MKNRILIVLFGISFLNCMLTEIIGLQDLNLNIKELAMVEGEYSGTLEYLNYSDDKSRVTLNMTSSFAIKGNKIKVTNIFDEGNGRKETRKGYYLIEDNQIDGNDLAEKVMEGDQMRLVWYGHGRDGNQNKMATFRFTFEGNGEVLNIRKEVMYEGTTNYFTRNLTQLKKEK